MTMSARMRVSLLTATLLLIAGCANNTVFTSTWKAPDVQAVSPVGKTVVALFLTRDEGKRRAAEDVLAADITKRGANGVAGYTILPTPPDGSHLDSDAARAKLKAAGANAVVMMRVVGRDQRVTYSPGYVAPSYYGGFGPYWGYGWGTVYQPGYLQTDTDVSVETLVYALTQDKLIWASTSRTTNPNDLSSLVSDVADATAKEMANQGFLTK
jgi:hypothetical protein